jgi:hypothetical protein
MDQQEWDACGDPEKMLRFLHSTGKLSERKARLFSVACCRRVWSLLKDYRSRKAVEVAERFADGAATGMDLHAAASESSDAGEGQEDDAVWAAGACLFVTHVDALFSAVESARCAAASYADALWRDAVDAAPRVDEVESWVMAAPAIQTPAWLERKEQAALLRDIFGPLPFGPLPPLPPPVRAWNDGIIPKLATAIYEERKLPQGTLDRDRLTVLADALEEVGVTDMDVLGHLRRPEAVHVRGCFLLDWLLEKA